LFFPQSSARLAHINIGGTAHGSAGSQHTNSNTDNVPRGDFGLIGLAVMGQNLILNAADHGYNVIAFNRTVSKVDHFLANEAKGKFYCPIKFGRKTFNQC
jgi:6-phosphogluconate dehydrogenase